MATVDSTMASELRVATKECLDRGLLVAAKWCGRQNLD
jgi:hypothetical protein